MKLKIGLAISILLATATDTAHAQGGQRGAPQAPQTARAAAPFDLTGYWVSIVSEDSEMAHGYACEGRLRERSTQ